MLKKVHFSIFLLLAFGIISSCKKEDEELSLKESEISIAQDRMSFGSKKQLESFIIEGKSIGFDKFKNKVNAFEISGFKSLMPLFDLKDQNKSEEFKSFRITQRQAMLKPYILQGKIPMGMRVLEEDIDGEDDELIADPYFASLLNRDREIEVGGKIYKYTEKGVFSATKNNYLNLLIEANKLESYPSSTSEKTITLNSGVELFIPKGKRENIYQGNKECTECKGSSTLRTSEAPIELVQNLTVCGWDPNIWDDIFGPAESCIDKFSSDKRVKTKAWAQNYGLFASTGIKVESQNRFLRVWWAEDINEMELGYSFIHFTYEIPGIQWPQLGVSDYQYEYGDYVINQYGQYVSQPHNGPKKFFEKFPLDDPSQRVITIYLFKPLKDILNKSSVDLTAGDVNNAVQDIIKTAYNKMKSFLGTEINGKSAVIVFPGDNKLNFLFANWQRNTANDNKITDTFNWNSAIIGFSKNGSDSANPIYDAPTSYKNFQAIVYGMGRRGTTWKGSRVVMSDDK